MLHSSNSLQRENDMQAFRLCLCGFRFRLRTRDNRLQATERGCTTLVLRGIEWPTRSFPVRCGRKCSPT